MVNNINIHVSNKVLTFLGAFGAVLVLGGIYIGFFVIPGIITNKIWETKILKENTPQWDLFMKTPFPFTFKVYIYDIQNPDEILVGEKPKVKTIGPIVYKVYKWKDEVEFSSPEEISYNSYMRYEFDQGASGIYTEDTEVTILNTPYLSVLLKIEETQPQAFGLLENALPVVFGDIDGFFVKVKIGDYLWRGLKFCENEGKGGIFAATMVCKQVIGKISESKNLRLENNTVLFANMYYKNNTHLGRFTIKSGAKNMEESGILSQYNGKPYISIWPGEKSLCNKIRGTTTIFPASVETDMVFESYSEDICRHVALHYDSDEIVKDIKGLKFVAKNDTFSEKLQENSCFCTNKSKTFSTETGCVKDGLTDLNPCSGGPIMVSFPHLLYGDKEYLDSVEGLDPDKTQHEPFVILEPMSGTPLYVAQRIQFNMFIRPIEGFENSANISRALIPLMWVEESFIIPDKFVDMLNHDLFNIVSMINILKWAVIIIGAACVLIASLTLVYRQAP